MATNPAPLLEVGRIAKPHGLAGEVVVSLSTTETSRVDPGSVLHAGDRALTIVTSQPHQHRWVVRFDGVDTREAAEALQGSVLSAEPKAVADEADDEPILWAHELIGALVLDAAGRAHGHIVTVHDNPASDLIELESGDLVPLRFVLGGIEDGPDGRFITVDPPDGLLTD